VGSRGALVLQAPQQEDIRWLGNVPPDKIEELEENGEHARMLRELRK